MADLEPERLVGGIRGGHGRSCCCCGNWGGSVPAPARSLWRLLPGRRGPARVLGFALAYALPIGLDALALLAADEGHGEAALDVSLTLLILTVTALAMDLETCRGEPRYWPSRLSLLPSVYQMRYLALQAAYRIAQIVAAITIWQFVIDGGGPTETPAKFQP